MLALTRGRILRASGDLDGAKRVLNGLREGGLPLWLRDELELDRAGGLGDPSGPAEVGLPQVSQPSVGRGRNGVSARVTTLLQSAAEMRRLDRWALPDGPDAPADDAFSQFVTATRR